MSDFRTLTLTFDLVEPWRSKVEIDGKLVTNVRAVRVEQDGPNHQPVVELEIIGEELTTSLAGPARLGLRLYCPACRRRWQLESRPEGHQSHGDARNAPPGVR